jgi:hypothetical protein
MTQLNEFEVRQMTQTAPEEQLVVESSRMLQENYFFFAEIVIDRLLQINPTSPNYNYRKGFIVLDSRQDWVTALPYLQKALVDVDKNFDMYSAKETSAPVDVYYHIARCYLLLLRIVNQNKSKMLNLDCFNVILRNTIWQIKKNQS